MAVACEDPCARALLWLGALALRVRRPARRLCGSVRLALVYAAALLGAYLLIEASMILRRPRTFEFDMMKRVVATVAILGAISDVFILAGIIGWGRWAAGGCLTRLLCGRLALASAHLPLALFWVAWTLATSISNARWWPLEHTAWEAGRFGGTLVLAALLYSLLVELHPGEDGVVSWVSTHEPSAAPAPAPALAPVEEPSPGPAPPPRRHL